MITLKRTDSHDEDFQHLVVNLDRYLHEVDGHEHAFYAQFNKTDGLKYVVVAYMDGHAVACGAIKPYSESTMEVKRMYVDGEVRGQGIATLVLQELERWALELAMQTCVLETGARQADAVRLYQKNGYHLIPNYGQYQGVENSVCFEKEIAVTKSIQSNEISIRFATPADAQLLCRLGKETFHDAFSVYPQMPAADLALYLSEEFTVAKFATQLADEHAFFLLAECAGDAVGYAKMEINQCMPEVALNNPIKLRRLYCKQSVIGRGVGAQLMERCVLEANERGHDSIFLTVWEHNVQAQNFYKKWSYEFRTYINIQLGNACLRDMLMVKMLTSVC